MLSRAMTALAVIASTLVVVVSAPAGAAVLSFIHTVQGSGPTVATPGAVMVQGVVTTVFAQNTGFDGFFVNEEDFEVDADPTTPEGIFVLCAGSCPIGLAVGDLVIVSGIAGDSQGMSRIDVGAGSVVVVSSNNTLPSFIPTVAIDSIAVSSGTVAEGQPVTVSGAYNQFNLFPAVIGTAVWSDGVHTMVTVDSMMFSTTRTFIDEVPAGTLALDFTVDVTLYDDEGISDVATSPTLTVTNTICGVGSFSPTGTAPCTPAPAGFFVPTMQATSATPCSPGTYQPLLGQSSCLVADVDHFVDIAGAVAQTPCPAGFSQPQVGQTSCIADMPDDADNDGVLDSVDVCLGTDLAADALDTPSRWRRNRYWSDETGDFVRPNGRSSRIDVIDTGGCSASQIIDSLQNGSWFHRRLARFYDRYGFSRFALRIWARTH